MELLLKLLGESSVVGIGQLLVGKWFKSQAWFPNRFVPIATFVAAVLGFQFAPTLAHAAATFPIGEAAGVVVLSLLQTQAISGTHTIFKNSVFPILKSLLVWATGKVTKI